MIEQIAPRREILNIGVYVPGKPIEEVQRELGLTQIIKLASNENPYGCSRRAKEAMLQEVEHTALYPEGTAPLLSERLSKILKVDKERIVVGNGSDEIIRLLTRSYIRTRDEAIMADVTFPRYETNVLIEAGVPVKVPLVGGVHDLRGMLEQISIYTRMIFVCNPNNPTGTIVDKGELQAFIEKVPRHILIVIDEAYHEYVTDSQYSSSVVLIENHPNIVVLRTFSKIYGLAGLRIGYGLMHSSIVHELIKVKEPFNTNRLAQAAAVASLNDVDFVQFCKQKNRESLTRLESALDRMGFTYFPSQGNFIMVDVPRSGDEVFQSLLREGVIVRSGRLLGYAETIRVSIGDDEEIKEFIYAMKRVADRW